jgi:uncharacterized protein YjbJ (UPF0337 family)
MFILIDPISQRRETMGVDKDRVEGSAKNMGGKLKEGLGKATGDSKTEAEGKADQAKGKVQNAVGGIKDSLKGK